VNFQELIKTRQSTRRYSDINVEKEKIQLCIEAARMAPSASNSQPWTFIVVDNPELKEKVAVETYGSVVSFNKFVHQVPVIIVIVIEKTKLITQVGAFIKDREFPLIDIGIAAEHLCLQAAELGLGTCMLGWFNFPKKKRIGLLITLGYPATDDPLRNKIRKTTEEMSRLNGY